MIPIMLECDQDGVAIDTSLIPQTAREDLAAAILEGVHEYFNLPGVSDKFIAWQEKRRQLPPGKENNHGICT